MPTISVIVPVYKVEKYIHQCVDSILGQTFRDFELILVDDGSPDNCGAICDAYARKDPRVRVIHQENGGLSAARNAGLDCARGDYIAFVDSDDWVHPEYLEQLLNGIRAENADLSLCNVQLMYDTDCKVGKTDEIPVYYIVAWNKLYHKALWNGIRFPVGYIHEDEAIIHHIFGRVKKTAMVQNRLYYYRQTSASIMGKGERIQTSDKLYAFADRIVYADERKWFDLRNATSIRFVHAFMHFYFHFPRNEENALYFRRMEQSLKTALPYILRCRDVALRHKLYLCLIRLSPEGTIRLRDAAYRLKTFLKKE